MADSCILLDVITKDIRWYEWSANALAEAAHQGNIIINPVIYAEISVRFTRRQDLEALLEENLLQYHAIPREAAFLAGKAFQEYRRRGGTKVSPLPDFFIGAHASVEKLPLITRDTRRFKAYFPNVRLITP